MKLFLSMLLSSNLLFLCFLLSTGLGGKHLSIHWKNAVLKLCLLLSIVPVAFFVSLMKSFAAKYMNPIMDTDFVLSGQDSILILAPKGFDMTISLKTEVFIIAIWLFTGLCIFLYRMFHYLAQRKKIIASMLPPDNQEMEAILAKQAADLNLHRPIALYMNSTRASSFTTGVWKPIIAVPSGLKVQELELVLFHELCHIKNGDNVYGFLRLFTLSLYWFNPLAYLADYYIENTAELCCDAKVIDRNRELNKSAYCHLIVEMAGLKNENKTYAYSFSRHGKNMEERVRNIMKTKKLTTRARVGSTLLAGCMVLCSSFPVLAYQSPRVMEIQYENHTPVSLEENLTFGFQTGDIALDLDKIQFDRQFTDINGNIYNAEHRNSDQRFECDVHSYVNGTFTIHDPHGDGSCTMEYYRGKRCTKCGSITAGDLYKTTNYVKCSH